MKDDYALINERIGLNSLFLDVSILLFNLSVFILYLSNSVQNKNAFHLAIASQSLLFISSFISNSALTLDYHINYFNLKPNFLIKSIKSINCFIVYVYFLLTLISIWLLA